MAETAVAAHERTLPHNLDAERSVLGAILIDNEAFNTAIAIVTSAAFFRDAHRRILRADDRPRRAAQRHRLRDPARGAGAQRRARGHRRRGLPGLARRRRAALHQRRGLRAHRQGKGHAAQPDLRGQQDRRQCLRGRPGRRPDPRRRRGRHLLGRRGPGQGRLRADAPAGAGQLPEDREAVRAPVVRHGRRHAPDRPRQDDPRLPARRSDHRRRPAVDGQDQPGAEHLPARRDPAGAGGQPARRRRRVQPRDVQGAAVHAHAVVGGEESTASGCSAARSGSASTARSPTRWRRCRRRSCSSTTRPASACSRCGPRRGACRPSTASTSSRSTTSS